MHRTHYDTEGIRFCSCFSKYGQYAYSTVLQQPAGAISRGMPKGLGYTHIHVILYRGNKVFEWKVYEYVILYIFLYVFPCIYIYIYIYVPWGPRERPGVGGRARGGQARAVDVETESGVRAPAVLAAIDTGDRMQRVRCATGVG